MGGVVNGSYEHCPADWARSNGARIRCYGGFADSAGNGLCETRRWRGYRAGDYRQCAGWSRHRFLSRARVLRSAALLLLPLCAAGLLCRASAGLFLRTSARCVLCSGTVLRAGILLPRILNVAYPSLACLVARSLWRSVGEIERSRIPVLIDFAENSALALRGGRHRNRC